jgi:hypothetical protein
LTSQRELTALILFLVVFNLTDCRPVYSFAQWGEYYKSLFSDELFLDLKGVRGFSVREFNRVDGFAPAFKMELRGIEEAKYPALNLSVIYYVVRETPGWEISLEKSFFGLIEQSVKFEAFSLTDSNDSWRISDLENSIASFLFKEDFRNYFEKRGIRLSYKVEFDYFHMVTVAYIDQDIHSLVAEDPFTLFGWAKEFRGNPAVDVGKQRTLLLQWIYDSRDNMRFPRSGWYNDFSYEVSPDGLHGDFSYRLFTAHIRRYNMISGNHFFNFRFSLALSGRELPRHKIFTVGGVGTLRGYPDLSDSGTNFMIGNAEFRFPIRGLNWKPLRIIFNEIQGILFLDVGDAWTDEWSASHLRTDVGVGISGANIFSYFGLYVAQAVERDRRNLRITVKMEREF